MSGRQGPRPGLPRPPSRPPPRPGLRASGRRRSRTRPGSAIPWSTTSRPTPVGSGDAARAPPLVAGPGRIESLRYQKPGPLLFKCCARFRGSATQSPPPNLKVERTSEPSEAAGNPEVPDASLVARIATQRDRQALDQLYRRHGSALYELALGILPDPVEARRTVAWVFRQAWRTPSLLDSALVPVSPWLVELTRTDADARAHNHRSNGNGQRR